MITKASPERKRLEALLAAQESEISGAFMRFVASIKSESALKQINNAIETRDFDVVYKIIESHIQTFANVLPAVFMSVGTLEAEHIVATQLKNSALGIGFDPTYPRAADRIKQMRFDVIAGLTAQQQAATQQALLNAFQVEGFSTRTVARAIQNSIGLTAKQEQAVRNYRALLESGNSDALDRQLRDRRFDRSIAAASRRDEPLSPATVDKMVDAYRRNYISFRAETIARTQGLRAMSEARQESLEQVMATLEDTHEAIRTWNVASDGRQRDAHDDMRDQKVKMTEPFVDGDGNMLMYPGDPAAPAETIINCRCNFTVEIVEKVQPI